MTKHDVLKLAMTVVVIIITGSSALAQRGYSMVPYLYCPSDSPRYGYVAYRNIRWCYAGPRGTLLNPRGFYAANKPKNPKGRH
jgi:hypothetical protein